MSMTAGLVGFGNNKKGNLPRLIRTFTRSGADGLPPISHTFVTTAEFLGVESVQEAGAVVQVVPMDTHYRNDPFQQYWLYEILQEYASNEIRFKALREIYRELEGDAYGSLQLLWFPWRWFNEKVLHRDIRHEKNWMTDGVICSELVYRYLWKLGPVFQDLLKDFNPDTIQAEDIRQIVVKNPKIFRLVEYKEVDEVVKVA